MALAPRAPLKYASFVEFFNSLSIPNFIFIEEDFKPRHIYAFDEIKLHWGITPRKVIVKKGKRHVVSKYIRRTDSTTILICIRADGYMLPLQILFKDDRPQHVRKKRELKSLAAFKNCEDILATAAIGTPFSTPETLIEYYDRVIKPDKASDGDVSSNIRALVISDSWWAHTDDRFVDHMLSDSTHSSIVPKACTGFVQVGDTHVNHDFRALFKRKFLKHISRSFTNGTLLRAYTSR